MYQVQHSRPGLLSMANKGPHTATSQWFVTLNPAPMLDGKHVAFGRRAATATATADATIATPLLPAPPPPLPPTPPSPRFALAARPCRLPLPSSRTERRHGIPWQPIS